MNIVFRALRTGFWSKPIRIAALLALASRLAEPTRGDEVTDWNAHLLNALHVANTSPGAAPRLGAIVHAAIFDAVNGIERRYTPVHVTAEAPRGASQRTAVVMAGYTTLVGLFPSQQADLDQKLTASLNSIASSEAVGHSQSIQRGAAWGQYVGQQILNWRQNDGSAPLPAPFIGGDDVGEWRRTPPGFLAGAGPQFATMLPWVLTSQSQFRPDGPPDLDSAAYAADYNEVKTMGSVNSAVRTADETLSCLFWATGTSTYNFNAAAERLSAERHLTLSDNARLFAHLNIAQADGIIACFDAKYTYVFWRPVTAIPLGDTDGNAATIADPTWMPLLITPNHPEYISGHSTISGASVRVLQHYFGNDTPVTIDSDGMPNVIRSFATLEDVIEEVAKARIYGGIHFRSACNDGRLVGREVADFVVDNSLVPRR